MNTHDLFEVLAEGELNGLSFAESGSIAIGKQRQILSYVNRALRQLHTRFICSRGFFTETVLPGASQVSLTDPSIVTIVSVKDALGYDLPIDKISGDIILRRLSPSIIDVDVSTEIDFDVAGEDWEFECQLLPAKILDSTLGDPILLPPALEEALILKVAARAFRSMSGEEHRAQAGMLEQDYEMACATAQASGLMLSPLNSGDTKLVTNGFI